VFALARHRTLYRLETDAEPKALARRKNFFESEKPRTDDQVLLFMARSRPRRSSPRRDSDRCAERGDARDRSGHRSAQKETPVCAGNRAEGPALAVGHPPPRADKQT